MARRWLRPIFHSLLLTLASTLFVRTTSPAVAEALPTVSILSIDGSTVNEGARGTTAANFLVRLSAPADRPLAVLFGTVNGTAAGGSACSAGVDYIATNGTLTFTPGERDKTVTVTVCGDTIAEADESFFVDLTFAGGATIAAPRSVGTILNQAQIRIADASVTEGNSGTTDASFEVRLEPASPLGRDVSVSFVVGDHPVWAGRSDRPVAGDACSGGVDYVARSGTVTIPAGQTRATIAVPICGDTVDEPTEVFAVILTSPVGAELDDARLARGFIEDDDDPVPSFSVGDAAVSEGDIATFAVTLSAPTNQSVSVDFRTGDGTAVAGGSCTAGVDYNGAATTLYFAPGETGKTVGVQTCGDAVNEPSETFFVGLANPANATISDDRGEGTIVNVRRGGGSFAVDPGAAKVKAKDSLTYTVAWTAPGSGDWRDLATLELRMRDDRDTLLWLRWDEATATFTLYDSSGGQLGQAASGGGTLSSDKVTLDLAETTVSASGPTVTLTLRVTIKDNAPNRTYGVELAAIDDFGNRDELMSAGTLTVEDDE